ncbi:hypothetical protein BN946_scf184935.g9 [Trametes cinnabarina]|uniref:Uncharacterized protein n=1 Tax=Pycnoporus cinnabarinus TaxID=5643 RepID=A0A060SSP3_PYCCI|nr:hypothetical protein BN946_scf184935.g9 [Trametes cinnabarina]
MLACELFILIWSHLILKVQHPPPVRLIDSKNHLRALSATPSIPSTNSRDATPVAPEPDLIASLTLSNNPVIAAPPAQNPVFGFPSLATTAAPSSPPRRPTSTSPRPPNLDVDMDDDDDDRDPDAMDIDPSSPLKRPGQVDDGSWLRPQRFFAPEEPTGLENLFARTIRLVDNSDQDADGRSATRRGRRVESWTSRMIRMWPVLVALCVVPLVAAAAYRFWDVRRRKNTAL